MVTRAGDRGQEMRVDRLRAGDRSCRLIIILKAKWGEGGTFRKNEAENGLEMLDSRQGDLIRGYCTSSER